VSASVKTRPRIRALVPLWGARYYERWLNLPAASLCAQGNIFYLHEKADFELVFLCKAQDLPFIRENAMMRRLGEKIRLGAITIDEFFPPARSVSYGVPLTLAYAKGIRDLGSHGLGAYVLLLNADFVLSEGSLAEVLERIEQGHHIITAPSLRVIEEEVRPLLEQRLSEEANTGCFAARAMMSIAERHLHQTVTARIVNSNQAVEAEHYHIAYWRLGPTCLAARSFLLMPLCFQVRRHMEAVTCPVDYGFIQEMCPGGRYTAICDSDELLMVELQERQTESELLDFGCKVRSPEEGLEARCSRVIANAAEWSTAEHRRSFTQRLLFHSEDLSADVADQLCEFDRFASRALEGMPPPVSAQRHFHWLGAVRAYRSAMGGEQALGSYPSLIEHDLNRNFVHLGELDPVEATYASPQWPSPHPDWQLPALVKETVADASAIVTLDGLVSDIWQLKPIARLFPVALDDFHDLDRDIRLILPLSDFSGGRMLCLYFLIDCLPHWLKCKGMCDAALASGGSVRILFRERSWAAFDPRRRGESWPMSMLHRFFDADEYVAQIELIAASPVRTSAFAWREPYPAPSPSCLGFIVSLASRITA
jgi:hypothetical protein